MRVEQQPCFILHSRAYRETSVLLECLTPDHGRIGLVARGVRRERSRVPRALLQPLAALNIGWTGRGELATLIAVEAAGPALPITGEALLCALYINELVLRLTLRHDPHPEVYDDYSRTLARLAGDDPPSWTLRRFERDLLAQLGHAPAFDIDALLSSALDPALDYGYRQEFGLVPWTEIRSGPKVRGATLLAFAVDEMPATSELPALRRLMRRLIANQLDGRELQAWSMMGAARQVRKIVSDDSD